MIEVHFDWISLLIILYIIYKFLKINLKECYERFSGFYSFS